ncbi:MAG TPA: hypothetical protein VMO26_21690 [Vicinamibacterales bacterium]|nr:hypothetical protein [Vicinamibacterales bacterium]
MHRLIALLLVALFTLPAGALAQDGQTVDPSKMGIDLSRIKRGLAETQAEEVTGEDPLRLRFTVEVVGTAPKIDFLEGFDVNGPMAYGSPTHREVLDVLTPKEYRSPVVPFYSLAVAAAQKLWQYNRKRQCEAEIEEYRRLVMQGVAMAAPRCNR